MAHTLVQKIIASHRVSGDRVAGAEIGIAIGQTLTQDATGTMASLQCEARRVSRVRTQRSVSTIDHSMLQTGFENAADHRANPINAGSVPLTFVNAADSDGVAARDSLRLAGLAAGLGRDGELSVRNLNRKSEGGARCWHETS